MKSIAFSFVIIAPKRRHDGNLEQRAERITFDAVSGHRYSLLVIKLCILIYTRTNCGLRTVVKILEIFGEVFEGKCGKVPCYNTVENWMKKLGLSVYENDRTPCRGGKYAVVVDESIFINSEKLLLLLGIPACHKGEPVVRWTKLAPMLSKNMERRMLLIAIIQDVSWDDLPIGYRSYIGNQQRHKGLLP